MWFIYSLKYVFLFSATKYCKLVSNEGGVELLRSLYENSQTSSRVKQLIDMTLEQCRRHVDDA